MAQLRLTCTNTTPGASEVNTASSRVHRVMEGECFVDSPNTVTGAAAVRSTRRYNRAEGVGVDPVFRLESDL